MERAAKGLPRFTFTERCRPVAQIGVADSRIATVGTVWSGARWDDALSWWMGTEPLWQDVSCEAFTFECEYGRMRTTDRYVAAAGTLLVRNASGWADPIHSDDPNLTTNMRPGRAIRVGVQHSTYGLVWLFRGFIDAVIPTYDPQSYEVVQLDCIDALSEVNRAKLAGAQGAMWPQETASARIERILDEAKWADSKRDIDPSAWELISSDANGQVADLLGQAAESVGGVVFGDLEARVCFRNRDWQVYPADRPVDGTIGNVEPTDVCPGTWVRPFARQDISTRIIVGRDPDSAYVLDDEPNMVMYGIEPYDRSRLLTASDPAMQDMAQTILKNRSASTSPRIRSVELDARTGDDVVDLLTTVDVFKPTRYRCRLMIEREGQPHLAFDREYFATGVTISMDANNWLVDLKLDLSAPYMVGDDPRWDSATWDYQFWAAINPLVDGIAAEARTALAELGATR
jgi:hypothetical protein